MPDVYVSPQGEEKPEEPKAAGSPNPKMQEETITELVRRAGERKRRAVVGAYWVLPGSKFINEQEDEVTVLLLRAHPITNLKWMMMTAVMLMLPLVFDSLGVFADLPLRFVLVGEMLWYLITAGFAFEKFLDWYYSVFIVTNERVVDIDFVNLMTRVVSYANLNHIEEPSMVVGGFLRSMFRYGNVRTATAAEPGEVEAEAVPYPDKVVAIISELAEELEKRRERGE